MRVIACKAAGALWAIGVEERCAWEHNTHSQFTGTGMAPQRAVRAGGMPIYSRWAANAAAASPRVGDEV